MKIDKIKVIRINYPSPFYDNKRVLDLIKSDNITFFCHPTKLCFLRSNCYKEDSIFTAYNTCKQSLMCKTCFWNSKKKDTDYIYVREIFDKIKRGYNIIYNEDNK